MHFENELDPAERQQLMAEIVDHEDRDYNQEEPPESEHLDQLVPPQLDIQPENEYVVGIEGQPVDAKEEGKFHAV